MDNRNNLLEKLVNHTNYSDYRTDFPQSSSDVSSYAEYPTRVAVSFMEMFQALERERNQLNLMEEKRNMLIQRLSKLRVEVEEQKRSYHEEMAAMRKKLNEIVSLDADDIVESKSESKTGDGSESNNDNAETSCTSEKGTDFVEAAKRQAIKKELSEIMKEILQDHPAYKY